MANTIKVTYKVNEDGSLEKISKKAEKAARSTDKVTQSKNRYNKVEKGTAQLTSNSTKAFSKMTSGINGGLVPAYAEIAARVFALTAAFNILARNNAIIKLEEALKFTGRAAGRNLPLIVESLKEITGAAISTEQAMRSVAVGVSAGFSQSQLEGLARVARGAAVALGRDMADAMDRLTRGAAKLEPEILDELGIMVRLDDAAKEYALSVNKSVSELTQFERRMAFTNAIISQGVTKFGELSEAIDPSPFDKASAALSNIGKTLVGGLSQVFAPLLSYLSENTLALGALVTAYAGLVGRSIIGGIESLSAASALNAERTDNQAKNALKAIQPNDRLGKAFNEVAKSGDRSQEALTRMQKSLQMTINMTSKDTQKLRTATKYRNILTSEIFKQELAQHKLNAAEAIAILQEVGLVAGLNAHIAAMQGVWASTVAATAQQTGFAVVVTYTTGVLTILGATASFAMAALFMVLGPIAAVTSLVAILGPMLGGMFGRKETGLDKQIKENTERFEEFNNVVNQFSTSIGRVDTETQAWIKTLRPLSGMFQELSSAIDKTIGAAAVDKVKALASANASLAKSTKTLQTYSSPFMSVGPTPMSQVGGSVKQQAQEGAAAAAQELEDAKAGFIEQVNTEIGRSIGEFQGALGNMKGRLEELAKEGKPVKDALTAVNNAMENSGSILKNLLEGNITFEEAANQIRAVSLSTQAAVNSFDKFSEALSAVKETLGDTASTWGTLGPLIDKVQVGINDINAILKEGGTEAANTRAKSLLEALGIEADIDGPIKTLERFQGELKEINAESKRLELETAKQSMRDTGTAAGLRDNSELDLLLAKITLQKRATEAAVDGTEVERQEQLKLIALVEQYNKALGKTSSTLEERAGRLGGEGAAQSSQLANTFGDLFSKKDEEGNTVKPSITELAETVNTAAAPMLETLRQLGPDGEVMSAAMQGALNLAEAFTVGFQQIDDGGSKVQAGLMMAGAAVQALGQLQQAQSNQAVSAIDKQIEAEKKRDGKSAASQAKLAALEKKKDAIKRKAFEQNKKMQMASTVINTASAIIAVMDDVPAPFNFALAGLVGAMGAAQLAAISSSSYDGGASSIAKGPSSISIGNRQNSVDLAKARSPSGELAYARGAQGTGAGMTNYTPAFTGAKYRAGGGNVGLMVGEQGPEMFIPDRPGTIVPADETQGFTGQPVNVNFSIQAIDSSSVEDLLMVQRGNIIGMIREAANSHGELFLENINNQSLPVDRQSRRY